MSELVLPDGGRTALPASVGVPADVPTGVSADAAPDAPAGQLPSLTGLRFAAAFLVFGFHLRGARLFRAGSTGDAVMGHLFSHGAIGVSFFFILSGFVLTWSAKPHETARRIWRKRAAKIYPNHLVTAVIALVGAMMVSTVATAATTAPSAPGHDSTSVGTVLPNLLLVQAWNPNQTVYYGLNTVSWSLSCEAFFYFCFPWLLKLVVRADRRALWPTAGVLVAIVWCLPLMTLGWSQPTAYWFVYVFPPARIPEFCLGIVLARIVQTGQWVRVPPWSATMLLVAAYVAIGYAPERSGYVSLTVIPLALLIPGLAVADIRGEASIWARRRMVQLGELSFAFYLLHQLVIRYSVKILTMTVGDPSSGGPIGSLAAAIAMTVVSVVAAWVLYRVIERPLNQRLRGSAVRGR